MTVTEKPSPADKIRMALAARSALARGKTHLTPAAQQKLHAAAYVDAQSAMSDLSVSDAAAVAAAKKSATQTAFGTGDLVRGASPAERTSVSITARDAGDRADQLASPEAALNLLQRAEEMGDETLARAIGQRAHQMGPTWDSVLAAFIAERPKQGSAVNSLRDARDPSPFEKSLTYILPKPPELDGVPDHRLVDIAGGWSASAPS